MSFSPTLERSSGLVFAFFAFVTLLFHLFGNVGHFGFDDMTYARMAYDLAFGEVNFNDHFSFRWPLVFLTAISYKLFGVNDFASSLPTIGVSLSMLYLVYQMLRKQPIFQLVLGLSLYALNFWTLYYSDKIMADQYVVFGILISIYALYQHRYEKQWSDLKAAILFGSGLLISFMSKGTVVLLIPFLLYLFITDLIQKERIRFWILSAAIGAGLLALYFGSIYLMTGNALARFQAIDSGYYENPCSYNLMPWGVVLRRLYYDYWYMLIQQSMMIGPGIVLVYFLTQLNRRVFLLQNAHSFFLMGGVLTTLSGCFMSISAEAYVPMCIDPRHYLFILPFCSIAASKVLYEYLTERKHMLSVLLAISSITLLAWIVEVESFWYLYLPLCLLLLDFLILPQSGRVRARMVGFFVLILGIVPFRYCIYASKVGYSTQREFVYEFMESQTQPSYIFSNVVQQNFGEYYNEFDTTATCQWVAYQDIQADSLDLQREVYVLRNFFTEYLNNQNIDSLPSIIGGLDTSLLVKKDTTLDMRLYKIEAEECSVPCYTEETIFNADYLSKYPNFPAQLSNNALIWKWDFLTLAHFTTDSLISDSSYNSLTVRSTFDFLETDSSKTMLVYSLEKDGKNLGWTGTDLVHAQSRDSLNSTLNKKHVFEDIPPGAELKIYLWNKNWESLTLRQFDLTVARHKWCQPLEVLRYGYEY